MMLVACLLISARQTIPHLLYPHSSTCYISIQLLYFIKKIRRKKYSSTSVVVVFRCLRSPKRHAYKNAPTEGTKTMHPRPRGWKKRKNKTNLHAVTYCSSLKSQSCSESHDTEERRHGFGGEKKRREESR